MLWHQWRHSIATNVLVPSCAFRKKSIFTVRRYALHGLCDRNSVCPSVRLSVCLSHSWTVSTWFDLRSWFLHGSPIILVSGDITFIPKFEGSHPERERWMKVGWVRISDFRPINRRISETVRDTTRLLLITNTKSNTRFRLVPPLVDREMTSDGNYALRCITHMCFGANH